MYVCMNKLFVYKFFKYFVNYRERRATGRKWFTAVAFETFGIGIYFFTQINYFEWK